MVNKPVERFKEPLTDLLTMLLRLSVTFSIKFRFFIHNTVGPPVWSLQSPLQSNFLLSCTGLNFMHYVHQDPLSPGFWLD